MQTEQEETIHLLSANRNVRLLLRTYGDYDLTMVVFCPKGKEGKIIQSINLILEEHNATCVKVSVGISWEKMDLTSFNDQAETENEINHVAKIERPQLQY